MTLQLSQLHCAIVLVLGLLLTLPRVLQLLKFNWLTVSSFTVPVTSPNLKHIRIVLLNEEKTVSDLSMRSFNNAVDFARLKLAERSMNIGVIISVIRELGWNESYQHQQCIGKHMSAQEILEKLEEISWPHDNSIATAFVYVSKAISVDHQVCKKNEVSSDRFYIRHQGNNGTHQHENLPCESISSLTSSRRAVAFIVLETDQCLGGFSDGGLESTTGKLYLRRFGQVLHRRIVELLPEELQRHEFCEENSRDDCRFVGSVRRLRSNRIEFEELFDSLRGVSLSRRALNLYCFTGFCEQVLRPASFTVERNQPRFRCPAAPSEMMIELSDSLSNPKEKLNDVQRCLEASEELLKAPGMILSEPFTIEQILALLAPFWVPISIPLIKAMLGKT